MRTPFLELMEIADEQETVDGLLQARANGVEYVDRDGRTFAVLHVPDGYAPRPVATATVRPRSQLPDAVDVVA